MRAVFLALWMILAGSPVWAQDDDKGYIVSFLESTLSGAGRSVVIDGFKGALSSRATFSRLSIADDDGIWITIEDGAISWNRAALLEGRIEVAELSAAHVILARSPKSQGATVEARSFSLPELPVSVSIGALRADAVDLGPDILGEAASVQVLGKAELSGGEGSASLSLNRIDGKLGELTLTGSYSNATGQGVVDLLAKEGDNGIAATLLDLPGRPSAELALHGAGGTKDFRADLALATDGVSRVTGTSQTRAGPDGRTFTLALKGDIAPLVQPDYRAFFGASATLEADGRHRPDGSTDLTRLVLSSAGLDVTGRLSLSPERLPRAAALTLRLGLPDNSPLVLPVAGGKTYARNGVLRLRFDAARGDEWSLAGDLNGFRQPDVEIGTLALDGAGQVEQPPGAPARIFGKLGFGASDLRLADPALARAVGPSLQGKTDFAWSEGTPLRLRSLSVTAGDAAMTGDLTVTTEGFDLTADGSIILAARDLARFSDLAGLPLGGRADLVVQGQAALLSGAFDLTADAAGSGLSIGQPMADRLLAKGSRIHADARRDEKGITLRALDLTIAELVAHAEGQLSSDATDLSATLDFSDLAVLGNGLGGSLTSAARLTGPPGARQFALTGEAADLRTGVASVDRLVRGISTLSLRADERGDTFALVEAHVKNPSLRADIVPKVDGSYALDGRIADIAPILPGFSGPLSVTGTAAPDPAGWRTSAELTGPGGTAARLSGLVARDFASVDLTLAGQGQLAILNPRLAPRSIQGPISFDLALNGRPSLDALSGRFSASGMRFVSPAESLALQDAAISGTIAAGQVSLSGGGTIAGGGAARIEGTVAVNPPFDGNLTVTLDRAQLRRPGLFESEVSGQITLTGPLAGGALIGGELRLAATEITVAAAEGTPPPLPGITHLNEPAASAATRGRAGAGSTTAGGPRLGPAYGLDLTLLAPARIFVRGRGLEAEMGGELHLSGTTHDVRPTGQFSLIRGRLSILGKRLVLDQGLVQLQGSMVPYLEFTALADSFGNTTTIRLDGPATKPEVHFSSTSGLPEEEVLSELLFGNSLSKLSAFQLVQLANAFATLTGRGGPGVVTRLRTGVGLDDLDIVADDEGNASVKAGKYLNDKLYSEVTVGADGKSKVELNLDLNSNLTLKGTVGTDGQTGAGVFFTKDY